MLIIVDYGQGNLASIQNMLKRVGVPDVRISGDPAVIADADRLILPGVGAFQSGMENLRARNLVEPLERKVLGDRIPVLGICLGMQLLSRGSEEGSARGLGWIDAHTARFRGDSSLRVPHMGWAPVQFGAEASLASGLSKPRFYFVHSYHVVANDPADVLGTAWYGGDFVAAVHRDNIYGVQFHPEKSHNHGMGLLRNFAQVESPWQRFAHA